MLTRKVLKAFSVLTLVFVAAVFIWAGAGTVYAASNTVFDVKGGQYIPVLIHNGMTDVASVEAYAQAKGASAAVNGTYFDAYATEDQVTAKGGDVNVLRAFGSLYGAPLNFPSGVLIENGRLLHGAGYGSATGQWGGYLGGVTKQGGFIVEQVTLNIGFIADGNRSTVWRVNHPSYEATSVTLYDEGFGRDVQLKPGDKAVIAEGGIIKNIVSSGPVKVPSGGFIVVASSSANVFYGNKNIDNSFSVGQQVSWTWEIDSPSGRNFKDVYFAVGSDTAKINGSGGTSRPYIGETSDGKISIGVGNAAECANALFLDGGGSVAYYKDGKYLNGPGRNVSNAIGFVPAGGAATPAAPQTPATPSASQTAVPTSSTVTIHSESFSQVHPVQGNVVTSKDFDFDAYNIGGNNYFKLRDLAFALSGTESQFEVGWDGAANAITITSGMAYTPVGGEMEGKGEGNKIPTATSAKVYLDGAQVSLTAYNIGGSNYFKLRDVGQALDFGVYWSKGEIGIRCGEAYTPD